MYKNNDEKLIKPATLLEMNDLIETEKQFNNLTEIHGLPFINRRKFLLGSAAATAGLCLSSFETPLAFANSTILTPTFNSSPIFGEGKGVLKVILEFLKKLAIKLLGIAIPLLNKYLDDHIKNPLLNKAAKETVKEVNDGLTKSGFGTTDETAPAALKGLLAPVAGEEEDQAPSQMPPLMAFRRSLFIDKNDNEKQLAKRDRFYRPHIHEDGLNGVNTFYNYRGIEKPSDAKVKGFVAHPHLQGMSNASDIAIKSLMKELCYPEPMAKRVFRELCQPIAQKEADILLTLYKDQPSKPARFTSTYNGRFIEVVVKYRYSQFNKQEKKEEGIGTVEINGLDHYGTCKKTGNVFLGNFRVLFQQ